MEGHRYYREFEHTDCIDFFGSFHLYVCLCALLLSKYWLLCDSCCDMSQNDTIGRIKLLLSLSSCQVIILIARMTFNCSTSCLMS